MEVGFSQCLMNITSQRVMEYGKRTSMISLKISKKNLKLPGDCTWVLFNFCQKLFYKITKIITFTSFSKHHHKILYNPFFLTYLHLPLCRYLIIMIIH